MIAPHQMRLPSPFQGAVCIAIALLLLAACSNDTPSDPTFHAEDNPAHLSDWGMISAQDGALVLSGGVTPYDLATPLFSDYALKLRTVWIPDGGAAHYRRDGAFTFPVGTVITKTFYYRKETVNPDGAAGRPPDSFVVQSLAPMVDGGALPLEGVRLIETRILARREVGWAAFAYVWNKDQSDAVLKRTGDIIPLTLTRADGRREAFHYVVPDANQCAGCHATNATTKEIHLIGLKARHLNKPSPVKDGVNQLDHWRKGGWLIGAFDAAAAPQNAVWDDASAPLEARARAYLDANCSHCHNPQGAGDTSGLNLEPDAGGPALGRCKSPIAAGGGSGGRPYDIVPGEPDQSITIFRMETTDPGAMMPELGRALVHEEGVALIANWIAAMEGGCS